MTTVSEASGGMAFLLYFLIALLGGTIGGMLALGGVLVTTSLLTLIPIGGHTPSLAAAGLLNLVLVTAGTTVSTVVHARRGRVDWRLVWLLGPPLGLGGLAGAALVSRLSDRVLSLGFALLALLAVVVSVWGRYAERRALRRLEPAERRTSELSKTEAGLLAAVGCGTGLLSGLVGAGGGFIINPVLMHFVRMPAKAVVGSMSIVGAFAILGNIAGRGSAVFDMSATAAAAMGLGGALGGLAGAEMVQVISVNAIRNLVLALIAFNAARVVAGAIW